MDTTVSTHPVSTHPREIVETDLHFLPVGKQKSNGLTRHSYRHNSTFRVKSPFGQYNSALFTTRANIHHFGILNERIKVPLHQRAT